MKKILIILLLFLLTSCSKNEIQVVSVNVGDVYYLKDNVTVTYNSNQEIIDFSSSCLNVLKKGKVYLTFLYNNNYYHVLFNVYEETNDTIFTTTTEDEKDNMNNESILLAKKYIESINTYKLFNITVYGTTNNYNYQGYSSVTSYLFEELTISESLLTIGTNARPGITREIKYIVIHDTANTSKTANALGHNSYLFNNLSNSVSWHYTVDDTYIVRNIPDNEIAWHAGDGLTEIGEGIYLGGGNKNGIGIEMAVNEGSDLVKTWQKTAKLTAYLMFTYDLKINSIQPHYAFSSKNCPITLLNNNLWDEFINYVEVEYYMLVNFSNLDFEIINNYNVTSAGRILDKYYNYNIKITDAFTGESMIF